MSEESNVGVRPRTHPRCRGLHRIFWRSSVRPVVTDHCSDSTFPEENKMNWHQVEGKWKQLKGAVKMKWGKLTGYNLDFIDGQREQLGGKIQERYGIAKEEAERQVSEWNPTISEPA